MGALCTSACESLGDVGGVLFTLAALLWGAWQRWQRGQAVQQVTRAVAEKDAVVQQLASMRPVVLQSLPALDGASRLPSPPPMPTSARADKKRGNDDGSKDSDREDPHEGSDRP